MTNDDYFAGEGDGGHISQNDLNRREVLSAGGVIITILLAGCSSKLPGTGPMYEQNEDLPRFPEDALEGEGWEDRDDVGSDQAYTRYEGETPEESVYTRSGVMESVDTAGERVEEVFQGIKKEEFELAHEAYWGDETEWGIAAFRHSNAWAVVGSTKRTGFTFSPDTPMAIDLAER